MPWRLERNEPNHAESQCHSGTLPTAQPDGERILTWEQVYDLTEVPTELIVVGSGVTGAEFASAYLALGIPVTLVSSRDRVLPGEDADASLVLEDVSKRRGMTVLSKSRMESVTRAGDIVTVTLTDVDEFNMGATSDSDATANSVAENAADNTAVGITASASDAYPVPT